MTQTSGKRVLLIGWDAADWEMINPLLKAGQMPALAQFLDGGIRGNLATIQPVLSPMLWTSIATGKRADKHGIHGFTEPLPDASGIVPVRSTSRKCKAIWNILTQSGMKSNVIGWFATSPAEPINGVMITDQFRNPSAAKVSEETAAAETVHPAEFLRHVQALRVYPDSLFADDILPFIPRLAEIDLKKDDRPMQLAARLGRVASVQNVATALIQSEPWDLMCVYYDAIDQFGHEFMSYNPPRLEDVSERDFELYSEVMRGCYRFHDMMLHALLQYVGPETTVILISDHGYECGHRRPSPKEAKHDPEGCHRPFGIVGIKGPGIRKNDRLFGASILDVTPTILTLLGLPIGMDMDGRPWLEIFEEPVKAGRIFSWEGIGNDKAGLITQQTRQDPAEAAQAIQQLVELGYIEAPKKDVRETVKQTIRGNKTQLVRSLLGTAREANAIPLLKELSAEMPANEWCILTLARLHIHLGQFAEARSFLESCSPGTRNMSQVQLIFASLAYSEGKKALALEHLKKVEGPGIDHPLLANQVGRSYLQFGRWNDAEAAFKKSLEVEPENPAALDGLAHVYLERGEPDKAVELALQAVGLLHYFPMAHFHLGLGLERLGKAREAIAAYETALSIGYRPRILLRRLAELYQPIDPGRAAVYSKLLAESRKRRIYKADIKSGFPSPGNSESGITNGME